MRLAPALAAPDVPEPHIEFASKAVVADGWAPRRRVSLVEDLYARASSHEAWRVRNRRRQT